MRAKSMEVFNVTPDEILVVYREKPEEWKGPYKLYKQDNYKTAYIEMENGTERFSIIGVKCYLMEENKTDSIVANELPRELPNVNDKPKYFGPKMRSNTLKR